MQLPGISMKKIIINTIFLYFISIQSLYAATLVYTLRISETTRNQIRSNIQQPYLLAFTGVGQYRQRRNNIQENYEGGLASFIYNPQDFYFRADIAAANIHQKIDALSFGRTQMDDILFTGGLSKSFTKRTKITISGLLGMPTHKDTSLEGVEFGTGHVGIGLQFDGSFFYSANNGLLGAARIVHFFPRKTNAQFNEIISKYNIHIGEAIDLLFVHSSKWNQHKFEIGYNPAFILNIHIKPPIDLISSKTIISSSFYASYVYGFELKKNIESAINIGFSYGLDHTPKLLGTKYALTGWLSWGINF